MPPFEIGFLIGIAAAVCLWLWLLVRTVKHELSKAVRAKPRAFEAEHELGREWERRMRDAG